MPPLVYRMYLRIPVGDEEIEKWKEILWRDWKMTLVDQQSSHVSSLLACNKSLFEAFH